MPSRSAPRPLPRPATPRAVFGPLFDAVQRSGLFEDSKAFPDAAPLAPPGLIAAEFAVRSTDPDFDLAAFVAARFLPPPAGRIAYVAVPGQHVRDHIEALWPILARMPSAGIVGASIIPMPRVYVVPGGRFGELYYWDSFFTMLGLVGCGHDHLALGLVENFASLVERFGHVPNGNRSYYLTRSQPPFLCAMVELLARSGVPDARTRFLPALAQEHAFWMEGSDALAPGQAHRRVVRLPDGSLLNRYWDDGAGPREESWREDSATAAATSRAPETVFKDIRAAAESGWDFSSRWLAPGGGLETIRTTRIAPVDLNCILHALEQTLASAYDEAGDGAMADDMRRRADLRRAAILGHFWDDDAGAFADLLWDENRLSPILSAATAYPLFFGVATPAQAIRVARFLDRELLMPGGLVTSTLRSGEQWDAPNGWAPLQWIAVEGLRRYKIDGLAGEIALRWTARVIDAFAETGRIMEKYDVVDPGCATGGGEYPNQDGFGWTNGVLCALMDLYPEALDGLTRLSWTPTPAPLPEHAHTLWTARVEAAA